MEEKTTIKKKLAEEKCKQILQYFNYECPICHHGLITRESKNGYLFIGCLNFPRCRFTNLPKHVNYKKQIRTS